MAAAFSALSQPICQPKRTEKKRGRRVSASGWSEFTLCCAQHKVWPSCGVILPGSKGICPGYPPRHKSQFAFRASVRMLKNTPLGTMRTDTRKAKHLQSAADHRPVFQPSYGLSVWKTSLPAVGPDPVFQPPWSLSCLENIHWGFSEIVLFSSHPVIDSPTRPGKNIQSSAWVLVF